MISSVFAAGMRPAPLRSTMLRLKPPQRRVVADKLPDLANLGAASLIFGQLVGDGQVSLAVMTLGAALWAMFFLIALVAAGDKK